MVQFRNVRIQQHIYIQVDHPVIFGKQSSQPQPVINGTCHPMQIPGIHLFFPDFNHGFKIQSYMRKRIYKGRQAFHLLSAHSIMHDPQIIGIPRIASAAQRMDGYADIRCPTFIHRKNNGYMIFSTDGHPEGKIYGTTNSVSILIFENK
ncbi:MAG: hypothetical protein U0L94_12480 [Akkermansia sp.]|uniref:hypothetical protein n=1 Tax=Akkermansia sp. TaxID=1872421 RepID=UPI0026716D46|nr:hypothetical protein [Akkermansia sp.]MEE0765676.1 hypothetical protein [Akkermansia sp.]